MKTGATEVTTPDFSEDEAAFFDAGDDITARADATPLGDEERPLPFLRRLFRRLSPA